VTPIWINDDRENNEHLQKAGVVTLGGLVSTHQGMKDEGCILWKLTGRDDHGGLAMSLTQ